MGQLTPKAHSLFDAYLICLLFLAPILFGIDGTPRWILWAVCAVHLLVTAISDTRSECSKSFLSRCTA